MWSGLNQGLSHCFQQLTLEESTYINYQKQGAHTLPCREAQNKEHSDITLQGSLNQTHFNQFDHLQILIFLSNSPIPV